MGAEVPPEVPSNTRCSEGLLCGTGAAVCALNLHSVPPEGSGIPYAAFHINGSRTACVLMTGSGNRKVSLKQNFTVF